MIIDVVGHRLKEKRRDEISLNIAYSDEDYAHGQVFRGTVAEGHWFTLMGKINETL